MCRRLGLRAPEVKQMPWWERRLYVEGLTDEMEREAAAAEGREYEKPTEVGLEDLGLTVRG